MLGGSADAGIMESSRMTLASRNCSFHNHRRRRRHAHTLEDAAAVAASSSAAVSASAALALLLEVVRLACMGLGRRRVLEGGRTGWGSGWGQGHVVRAR